MIKLKDVNKEIKTILATDRSDMSKHQENKLKKRLQLFELCKKYLETNPSVVFIEKEKSRIEKLVESIAGGFGAWQSGGNAPRDKDFKQQRGFYEKETNLKHFKLQLKTLEFILT